MERQKPVNIADEVPLLGVQLDPYRIQILSLEILTGRNPKEKLEIKVSRLISLKTINKKGKTIAYKYEVLTDLGLINLTNTVSGDDWKLDSLISKK